MIEEIQHLLHTHPILSGICIAFFLVVGVAAWGEVPPRPFKPCEGCRTPRACEKMGCYPHDTAD